MKNTIEIINYVPKPKGYFLGHLAIYLPSIDLEIDNICLWQKGSRRWFTLPAREYIDKESKKKKYMPFLRFRRKEVEASFMMHLKEQFEKWCKEHAEN